MFLNGYKVVITRGNPRQSLVDSVMVSDSFREEFNSFLCSFFGYVSLLPKGQVIINEATKSIVMTAETAQTCKQHLTETRYEPNTR